MFFQWVDTTLSVEKMETDTVTEEGLKIRYFCLQFKRERTQISCETRTKKTKWSSLTDDNKIISLSI